MRADEYEQDRLLKWALAEGRGTATPAIQVEGLKALLRVRRRRQAVTEYISFQSLVLDTPFYRAANGDLSLRVSNIVKAGTYRAMRALTPKGSVGLSPSQFMRLDPVTVSAALSLNLPTRMPPDDWEQQAEATRARDWAAAEAIDPTRGPLPDLPVDVSPYADAPARCAALAVQLMAVNAALEAIDVTTADLTLSQLQEMVTQQYAIETLLCGTPHLLSKGVASYEPLVFDVANYFAYGMLMGSLWVEIDVLSITTNLSGVYKSPEAYAPKLPPSAQP